jgi:hypothetical protein
LSIGEPKSWPEIWPIVSNTALGFAYAPYGRPTRSIRVGKINNTQRINPTPIIAWRIWLTAGFIFSSLPHERIIRNPPQMTKAMERSPENITTRAIHTLMMVSNSKAWKTFIKEWYKKWGKCKIIFRKKNKKPIIALAFLPRYEDWHGIQT